MRLYINDHFLSIGLRDIWLNRNRRAYWKTSIRIKYTIGSNLVCGHNEIGTAGSIATSEHNRRTTERRNVVRRCESNTLFIALTDRQNQCSESPQTFINTRIYI